MKLNILLAAYACEPGKGSEPEVGWNWALQAAQHHDVWVLTRRNNEAAIEEELRHTPRQNLHFIYHDLPRWSAWWKRGTRGVTLYYLIWQLTALRVARRHHRLIGFDCGHHITFVSFRHPSFLAFLGIPYIWGPVGGGERSPRRFWLSFGIRGFVQELIRDVSNLTTKYNPLVRVTAARASLVLTTTADTARLLPPNVRAHARIMPAIGLSGDLEAVRSRPTMAQGSLRLLYVGRLIYWKGVQYAIRALAAATASGLDVDLIIIGDGPYRRRLEVLAQNLGVRDRVIFEGILPHEVAKKRYSESDIFIFPSLHDSGGLVVLEAMSAGLPVVCLDLGGPGQLVRDDAGIRIKPGKPQQVAADLANTIESLAREPETRMRMGVAGMNRVNKYYTWSGRANFLRSIYQSCVSLGESP